MRFRAAPSPPARENPPRAILLTPAALFFVATTRLQNVWTTGCQPAWDNPYGNSTCELHSEQLVAIATLSAQLETQRTSIATMTRKG